MMCRAALLSAAGLLLTGCPLLLPSPTEDQIVLCEDSADCPAGFKCVQVGSLSVIVDEYACIQTDPQDSSPPQVELDVGPPVAGLGVEVGFSVDVFDDSDLFSPPTLELYPPDQTGAELPGAVVFLEPELIDVDESVAGPDRGFEGYYHYTQLLDGELPQGQWTVEAIVADRAGNTTGQLLVGSFIVDFDPPQVDGVAGLDPTSARADELVSLAIRFNEPVLRGPATQLFGFVNGEPVGALDIGEFDASASVEAVAALPFTTRTPVSAPDGELTFSVSGVVDRAGNVSGELPVSGAVVTLDGQLPAVVGGVQVNAGRFSSNEGFNRIELSAAFSEPVVDAWARTSSVLAGGLTLSFTCERPEDDLSVACAGTVPSGLSAAPGTAPQTVILYIRAVDAAGNELNEGVEVALDFAPPAIVTSPVELEVEADDDALLPEPVAAGIGTEIELAFLVDEQTGESPVVTLQAAPPEAPETMLSFVLDEQIGLSFLYAAPVEALTAGGQPQPEGAGTLQIELVDEVGNRATYSAAAELPGGDHVFALDARAPTVVDVTPPAPPNVAEQGRVVYLRAPWGALDTSGGLFRVDGTLDDDGVGPVEPGAIVRATAGQAGNVELGRVVADDNGAFFDDGALNLAAIDRAQVFVQTIDAAGNASPLVGVRDVRWIASMGSKIAGTDLGNPHRFVARQWDEGALTQRNDIEVSGFQGVAPDTSAVLRTSASARWVARTPGGEPAFRGPKSTLARDPTTGVLYGWFATDVTVNAPIEFRYGGQTWVAEEPIDGTGDGAPGVVLDIAWDPRRERWVGVSATGTWERTSLGWELVDLATQEAPSNDACGLAYHHELEVMLTWDVDRVLAFDGAVWSVFDASPPPPPRRSCGLTYDARRRRLVLMGGIPPLAFSQLYDVWEHDVEEGWVDAGVHTPPSGPTTVGGRFGGAPLAYDAERGRTWFVDTNLDMTTLPSSYTLWEWTGEGWVNLVGLSGAMAGFNPAFAARAPGAFVLHGGEFDNLVATRIYSDETWEVFEHGVRAPRALGALDERYGVAAAPDASGGVVWFGGEWRSPPGGPPAIAPYGDTRRYLSRRVTELVDESGVGSSTPDYRGTGHMVYDSVNGGQLLVGGETTDAGGDLWRFNGAWSKLYNGPHDNFNAPTARQSVTLVFDEGREELLLFGGLQAGNVVRGDLWAWDGGSWSLLVAEDASGAAAPSPRTGAVAAYDAARGRVVLFGGSPASGLPGELLDDTWVFENGAWAQLSPANVPPPRANGALVYSPVDARSYLIAGEGEVEDLSDVWAFNGVDWARDGLASPYAEGVPAGREHLAAAFHAQDQEITVYGGRGGFTFGDLYGLQPPHNTRAAHVMQVVFASAGAGQDAIPIGLDIGARVGGAGSVGPDCIDVAGALVQIFELDRWVTVARTSAGAAQPALVTRSIDGQARLRRAISGALRRSLHVRVVPSAPGGCSAVRGTVATDSISVGVRYVVPADRCGDGIIDVDEVCDGDAGCGPACRPIACGDGRLEGAEACDDGNVTDGDGCSSTCEREPSAPTRGDVLITEVMPYGAAGFFDILREYVEVTNVSGRAIDLRGATFEASGLAAVPIDRATWLEPGEAIVFARLTNPADNGDLDVRFRLINGLFENFDNDSGSFTLSFGGEVLDTIAYSSATEAVAWQVRPELITPGVDPDVNDDPAALCASPLRYGRFGAFGSPGRANPPCP